MEHGDLEAWDQPRLVVVLEGVLADVLTEPPSKRWYQRQSPSEPYLHWHELPLKRTAHLKRTYPDAGIDVVTFHSDAVAEAAAEFLYNIDFPVSSVGYHKFEDWVFGLRFRMDIQSIYDSSDERLEHYGVRGYKVIKGRDFG